MTKKELYKKLCLLSVEISWTSTMLKVWGERLRDGKMLNEGQLLESIAKTTKEWAEEGNKACKDL